MPALFQIGNELLALNEAIENLNGDTSDPDINHALEEWMRTVAADESDKIASYVAYIKHLEMEAVAAESVMLEFKSKMQSRENRIAWLKDNLKAHMEKTGRISIRAANGWVVAVQKNGGKKPLVLNESLSPADLPPHCVKVVKTFDTDAIRKALEDGEDLGGYAYIGEPGTHVRIK